jgi:hypothetical protein
MREGQRKPREVPGKSQETQKATGNLKVTGKSREDQGSPRKSSLRPRKCQDT